MKKKIWTPSTMGKKGIKKLKAYYRELGGGDEKKGRKKQAKLNAKEGKSAGGRPEVYDGPCTAPVKFTAKSIEAGTVGKPRGRHRFNSKGICDCGAKRKAPYKIS